MWEPKILESDVLQSENFVEESSPGAGDGKGWRLCRNGDFHLPSISQVDGVIHTKYASIDLNSSRQFELGFDPDKQRYLDEKHLREAGIDPARVMQAQMATHCDLEVVVRIDLPEGVDQVNAEGYARSIRQIVMDTVNSSEVLKGMRSGRITTEQTARVDADAALASRIGGLAGVGMGLDLDGQARYFGEKTRDPIIGTATGKEYLYVKQPGWPVAIGDLQKCCGRDTFTEQFLNREVRSDLKPEVACALSMAAPMTANGKVPINNLPRPVDDDQ